MGGVKEKSWGQCDQKIRGNIQNEEITREAQLHATLSAQHSTHADVQLGVHLGSSRF